MRRLVLLLVLAPLIAAPARSIDRTNLDPAADPCTDFDRFANGGWKDRTPIPAKYPSFGSFQQLREDTQDRLRKLLDAAATNEKAPPGSVERKLGDFWAAAMDEKAIEKAGLDPLRPELARIAAVENRADLVKQIAHLQRIGGAAAFGFGATTDLRDSDRMIAGASQGGLGLTDRDDYFRTDEKSVKIREDYRQHLVRMFVLLGDTPEAAASAAEHVIALETKLAEGSKPRVELRDPEANYHKLDLLALAELMPGFSWPSYFEEIGAPQTQAVDVGQPVFFQTLNRMLDDVPLQDWKDYLRWHLLNSMAPYLSTPFVDQDFAFYGTTLTGAPENLPRWQRMVGATSSSMGDALGRVYVERYFPAAAKARVLEMLHGIEDALRARLKAVDWMSEPTRERALAKLAAITEKIGYPDKWRDYSSLEISRKSLVANVMAANGFEHRRDMAKIGEPVDRSEWMMPAFTVNAYYSPTKNEIVFPAGILQPPFFDPSADDALNYGAIGAVIGHEITHGFDDQGRKFDAQGNLADWWTAEDAKRFSDRASCVEKQFSAIEIEEGLNLDGKLVLGEAIADLGGLGLAHDALAAKLAGDSEPPKEIDGFSPEQRFFLGWAQVWRANERPEYRRLRARNDPHPPPAWRIDAPLSNLGAFADAFRCAEGTRMVRGERCGVW
jgi:predicted metalloendopeptidase